MFFCVSSFRYPAPKLGSYATTMIILINLRPLAGVGVMVTDLVNSRVMGSILTWLSIFVTLAKTKLCLVNVSHLGVR